MTAARARRQPFAFALGTLDRLERVVYRANSLGALLEAARAALGVAALPCFLAGSDTCLRRLVPPIDDMGTNLWLITHPDMRRMPRVRAVMEAIATYVTARRSTLEA